MQNPTSVPDELSTADESTIVAAIGYFADDIATLRDQSRQADTKAATSMTVVGLMIAAATVTLPRISGGAFVLGLIATVLAVLAGFVFGMVIMPRTPPWRDPTPQARINAVILLIQDPPQLLLNHAHEISELTGITYTKYRLVQIGLSMLGIALSVAAIAAFMAL